MYSIEPLTPFHERAAFECGIASLDRYIKQQASQDVRRDATLVFVMTERDSIVVVGYYTLSNFSVLLAELPCEISKQLPKNNIVGCTLLGRLAVDRNYSIRVRKQTNFNPRLGELSLTDAELNALKGTQFSASFALIVDVLQRTEVEKSRGSRDPMDFYLKYNYQPFPGNSRRLFKPMKTIRAKFSRY